MFPLLLQELHLSILHFLHCRRSDFHIRWCERPLGPATNPLPMKDAPSALLSAIFWGVVSNIWFCNFSGEYFELGPKYQAWSTFLRQHTKYTYCDYLWVWKDFINKVREEHGHIIYPVSTSVGLYIQSQLAHVSRQFSASLYHPNPHSWLVPNTARDTVEVLWVLGQNTELGAFSLNSTPNTHTPVMCKCELMKHGF